MKTTKTKSNPIKITYFKKVKEGKLSPKFYRVFGGSCRRVAMDGNGKMAEFPYDLSKAIECTEEGPHPHVMKDRVRGRRRPRRIYNER